VENNDAKVTGVGGIFFKCDDPDKVKNWYAKHLSFPIDQYGASFTFRKKEDPSKNGYLQWSPFKSDTTHFKPSEKEFMVNYRVQNIEALVEKLKADGVTVVDKIEEFDYGKFIHIMDCEGNKIELWEPVDEVFDKFYEDQKTQ